MKTQRKQSSEADGNSQPVTVRIDGTQQVSGLLQVPPAARACYVLAHGAGAGMTHPFLTAVAGGLAARGIATLRYQFPYMEQGSNRPDAPKLAQATVRAAAVAAARLVPSLPLFVGGKSFGGRMSSQAQAASALPDVRGLIFLGFPLHPPGKPSRERAEHLFGVQIPMLFLQGDKDEFAQMGFLEPVIKDLGPKATLKLFPEANHSFHVPARSGRKDAEVMTEMLEVIKAWTARVSAASSSHPKAGALD